jgi:hypothetical protein
MRGGRDRLPADLRGERPVQAASREPILVRADGQPTAHLVDGTRSGSPSLERELAGQRPELTHLRKEQHRRRERSPAPFPSASERGPSCPVHGIRCNSRTPLRGSRCTGRNAPPTLRADPRRLTMTSWPKLFLRPTHRGKAPSPRKAADGHRSVNESNRTGDTRLSSLSAGWRAELGFGWPIILRRRRTRCQ